jgi:hypothetical protein
VLALITHIEAGCFQRQLKTDTVLVDLTAAYDTVGRDGLMLKFINAASFLKLYSLLDNMLGNRYFQVFLVEKIADGRD